MHAVQKRRCATLTLAAVALMLFLAPGRGWAAPVLLKLSFYTSDRSAVYECQVKPFVNAVNAEGAGIVKIEVYFSGAISPSQAAQPELVRSGAADLATIVPGVTPKDFPDSVALSLPGLFRDGREAALVFTRLVAADALRGYDPFFVVGAYVSGIETIDSRKPIGTLADLKGQSIRVNNEIVADVLKRLGAQPAVIPINLAMDALSQGQVDGVAVNPGLLSEFGFSRLVQHHYLLGLGVVPLAIVMNRDRFASLPPRAQDIIRKYSGDWFARQETACNSAKDREAIAQWRATARRVVVDPSPADQASARLVFDAVIREWTAASGHNRELMDKVTAAIAAVRKETDR